MLHIWTVVVVINLHTKFEGCSFSHIPDIWRGPNILTQAKWPKSRPFCPLILLLIRSLWKFYRRIFGPEELVKFLKSSTSGASCGNFLKVSSTVRDVAFFHTLARTGISDWMSIIILPQIHLWTRKSALNLGNYWDSGGGVQSQSALVFILIHILCLLWLKPFRTKSLKQRFCIVTEYTLRLKSHSLASCSVNLHSE